MFIDYVEIEVQSGKGGDGCVSFRREKFIPKGGPDGGDGGRGGDIKARADDNITTLLDYRYHRKYKAENGRPGSGALKTGRDGKDVILKVPVGTVIKDLETGMIVGDLDESNRTIIIVPGGKGGKGNDHFKSSTNQTPRQATPGAAGTRMKLALELKLLADVGLVGYPNAGKSTLLSRVSAARPKIADYPFTTLVPNLGIVKLHDYRTLVMADIPGIIEGASEGKGLGTQFLRHIQRTAILIFIVDGFAGDIEETFGNLHTELKKFDPDLVGRKIIRVVNKIDIIESEQLSDLKRRFPQCLFISAATGDGIETLLNRLEQALAGQDDNQ
jgi:GTP-binding protein